MSNIITGQLAHVNQPYTNQQGYTNQTLIVLVEPGQFQSYVEISIPSAKAPTLLQNLQIGGHYNFHVNIRGSKNIMNSTKVQGQAVAFNSVSAWKIEPQVAQQPQQQAHTNTGQNNQFQQPVQNNPTPFGNNAAPQNFGVPPQQNNSFFGNNSNQQGGFPQPQQGGFIGGNGGQG